MVIPVDTIPEEMQQWIKQSAIENCKIYFPPTAAFWKEGYISCGVVMYQKMQKEINELTSELQSLKEENERLRKKIYSSDDDGGYDRCYG